MAVLLVGRMLLAAHLAPSLAVVREEGVGLLRRVVNLRQAEAVGLVDEILVEAGPTDDKDVFINLIYSSLLFFIIIYV